MTAVGHLIRPLTTWRLAGSLLLVAPVGMAAIGVFGQLFQWSVGQPRNHLDELGILLVIFLGASLARGSGTQRAGALFLCLLYLLLGTVLMVAGLLQPEAQRKLTLFIPIAHPQAWHYLLVWLLCIIWYAPPAMLLMRPERKL